MNMAKQLAIDNHGWFDVNQYDNLDNPDGHFKTLGPEIWEQTDGLVTHFVAGGSTGGTITGTSKFLKAQNPNIKCVLADPMGSVFHEYFMSRKLTNPNKFLVEGVGKESIPGCMDFSVIDSVIQVTDEQSFQTCHQLARKEGLMVGGSAGLNTWAAIQLANQLEVRQPVVQLGSGLSVSTEQWFHDVSVWGSYWCSHLVCYEAIHLC
jgi:cystathionine beta-synthase